MKNDLADRLLRYQQIRLGIENLTIPVLLILFNIVLALIAILSNDISKLFVFISFAVFSILIQGLVILYSKYWRGRGG
jgi:hypothetical protein